MVAAGGFSPADCFQTTNFCPHQTWFVLYLYLWLYLYFTRRDLDLSFKCKKNKAVFEPGDDNSCWVFTRNAQILSNFCPLGMNCICICICVCIWQRKKLPPLSRRPIPNNHLDHPSFWRQYWREKMYCQRAPSCLTSSSNYDLPKKILKV